MKEITQVVIDIGSRVNSPTYKFYFKTDHLKIIKRTNIFTWFWYFLKKYNRYRIYYGYGLEKILNLNSDIIIGKFDLFEGRTKLGNL